MKKNYLLLLMLFLTFGVNLNAQILTENFDDDSQFTKSGTFFTDGSDDYFGILDPVGSTDDFDGDPVVGGIPSYSGFTNNYLIGEDLDGGGGSATQTLTWSGLNINGFTDLTFSVFLGADTGGFDAADEITFAVNIDGGGYTDIISFSGSDTNTTATDGSINLSTTLQEVTANIVGTGTTLDLRLTVTANSGNEEFAIDTIVLDGTAASSDPTIAFDATTSSETETDATFSVNVPVTVSNYSGSQIDVDVTISGGTAEMADYTLNTASLSFTADGTQNVSIDIVPDTDDFDDETIIITLTETSSVTDLDISGNTHTITVTEDESPPAIGFDNATSTETETDATFTSASIPITVSNYSGTQIDVDISVTGGTAEAGDYTFTSPTSLSFTTDETQNITVDINEDTDDFDDETIILTMTETSSVSGLVISQSTHTITITEDEMAPVPTAGSLIITEVLDSDVGFNNDYLEIFNNSSETVSLSTTKLIRMSSGGTFEYAYDFGVDESTASADLTIPAYGFMIIARGSSRSDFNTAFGITLDAGVSFNGGRSDLFFGTGRRWSLKTGGTADTDDGTLIDDTLTGVGTSKDYRNIFTDTFITGSTSDGTPGSLEYLLYIGDAWVNSTSMDATTGTTDAYFYSDYMVSSDADANDIGIDTGNTLTLNSATSLDVNGNLTVNGSLSINSSGSIIVDGTSTGNITYNRNLATTNWYMVSSPVAGQTIVDFYTNESPALGSGSGDAQNVAIAPYDNSGATASDRWVYYTEGQVDGVGGDDTTDTFTSGTGYSVKMQATGDIAFTGTIPVSDFTTLSLTDNSGGSGNAFNLMGNPYPSYIASDNTANATNNILSVNTSLLTEETIWIWDQSNNAGAGGYDTYNNTSGFYIAPGQAFFVSANGASSTFSITEAMQSHQGTDTFQRTENPRPEINITLSNGTEISDSNILYIDGTTTGFDNGYDSSIFGGISNPFTIYTHAVANGNGRNLGIQSLPNNNFENMIIPLGMNATSGLEITISANAINLPAGINVYLEDKDDNSFTLLDSSSNFITTLTSNQNGIGRFFIHTTSEALSIDDVNLDNISIYTSNNNLRIVGIQSGNAQVKIYNILGKQILNAAFEGNGVNDVTLPNLRRGVYIVQLNTETGTLNKKIIIE